MLATIVNAAAIIVGTTLGLVLKTRLAERYRTVVFSGIGVASLLIGISMALQTQRTATIKTNPCESTCRTAH